MNTVVKDIIRIMDKMAPVSLAEKWDNPGLQVGDTGWAVKKIVTALDPLAEVIQEAIESKADMLITHHPLIFTPLKTIDFSASIGKIIAASFTHKLAVFSAHTNLDSTRGGLNDIIAEALSLKNIAPLSPQPGPAQYKLVFFVPESHKQRVLEGIFKAGAGIIGNYTACSFAIPGTGSFTPSATADPFEGEPGMHTRTHEIRVETVVDQSVLEASICALKACHPYETPAFDLYRLTAAQTPYGIGRTGESASPQTALHIADALKSLTGTNVLKTAGDLTQTIRKVAICTGSGSGLFKAFLTSGADLYVSGDMHYHDARIAEEAGKVIIDLGHFTSEKTAMNLFNIVLSREIKAAGFDVDVKASSRERDPFHSI